MIITITTQSEPLQATSLPDARLMLAHRGLEATGVRIEAPHVGYKMDYEDYQLAVVNRDVKKLKRGLGL